MSTKYFGSKIYVILLLGRTELKDSSCFLSDKVKMYLQNNFQLTTSTFGGNSNSSDKLTWLQ